LQYEKKFQTYITLVSIKAKLKRIKWYGLVVVQCGITLTLDSAN